MSGTVSVSERMSTSELIRYISHRCTRHGDLLVECMDYYGVNKLAALTADQLLRYIDDKLGGIDDVD